MSGDSALARSPRWLLLHAFAVFAFLYLPIVVLIIYSFNGEGVGGFPPRNLTLDWYRILFADGAIWDSVINSIEVAFAAMAIALVFGIPAALALDRAEFPGKALFRRLVLLAVNSSGNYHGAFASDVVPCRWDKVQHVDDCARPWNGADLRGDDGGFRRFAQAGSGAGRSVSRPGSELLADVLASDAAKSEAADYRRCAVDFYAIDGRDCCELFSDRAR